MPLYASKLKNAKWPFSVWKCTFFEESLLESSILGVKTASGKCCKACSLACLSLQKWLAWDIPFYVKICAKLTHPLQNTDFQSIFARGASAVTRGEKRAKLWPIEGSPLRFSNMYVCMYVYSFKTVDKSQHRQYRQ